METVSKERWNLAIAEEDKGWSFENREMYNMHEVGNLHGQMTYAKYLGFFKDYFMKNCGDKIYQYNEKIFDLKDQTVLDVCGGPSSLLLRSKNFKRAIVLDPGDFPSYITDRYRANNIEVVKLPAEEFDYGMLGEKWDQVILYNALAHCYSPEHILLEAKKNCKTMRMCEGCSAGTNTNHPQNLTQKEFEDLLQVKGEVVFPNDPPPSPQGEHFFGVWNF